MNYYKLYKRLDDKMENLLLEFYLTEMTQDTYDTQKKRLRKIINEVKKRIKPGASMPKINKLVRKLHAIGATDYVPPTKEVTKIKVAKGNIEYQEQKQEEATALFLQNKKFISIDVECDYQDHSIIKEIGFTTLKNGVLETTQIFHDPSYLMRDMKDIQKQKDRFKFGHAHHFHTLHGALTMLKKELEECDVLVGHELSADKKFLSRHIDISRPNEFDTVLISRAITGQKRTLRTFAAMFGVLANVTHNAGNDSRYTMEALLGFLKSKPEIKTLTKKKERALYYRLLNAKKV